MNAPTTNTALLLEVDGHDLERRGQSISALLEFRAAAELREKDARIRELEGVVKQVAEYQRSNWWELDNQGISRWQRIEKEAEAALARSEEASK